MRLYSSTLFSAFAALAGCATVPTNEAFEHCVLDQNSDWSLVARPPNAAELLSIVSGKGTINSELELQAPAAHAHEHWFTRKDGALTVCRHEDIADSCSSRSTSALLYKSASGWVSPEGVFEKVCWWHERTAAPNDKSLEPTRGR